MSSIRSRGYLVLLASVGILLWVGVLLRFNPFQGHEKNRGLKGRETEVLTPQFFRSQAEQSSVSDPLETLGGGTSSAFEGERDNAEIYRQEISKTLTSVIREKFPEARFSEGDVGKLAKSIQTIRDSMEGLQELERTKENAPTLRYLHGEMNRANQTFREIMGMDVAEFIECVREKDGIDHEMDDGQEMVFEYLPPHEP